MELILPEACLFAGQERATSLQVVSSPSGLLPVTLGLLEPASGREGAGLSPCAPDGCLSPSKSLSGHGGFSSSVSLNSVPARSLGRAMEPFLCAQKISLWFRASACLTNSHLNGRK